jgi:fatty acid kinase fatty acid binding subunit
LHPFFSSHYYFILEGVIMSKVALVTDSTAYIPKNLVVEYGISVAPQILIWGDENYRDGVDIQPKEFYERLKSAKTMPSSSQVTPKTFIDIFKGLLEHDHQVLAILLSSDLSGTIASAIQAKDIFPGSPIEIVDSRTTAMAMGYLTLMTARAIEAGANLAEAKALAEKAKENIGVIFAVDTLEFLYRGGRIGGGSRFLGTALNIKPILEVTGGKVEGIEKVRTRSKSLTRVVEIIGERIAGRTPVRMATLHANDEDDAKILLKEATERFQPVESILAEVSPVVGTHAGPGTVGLAFMAGI